MNSKSIQILLLALFLVSFTLTEAQKGADGCATDQFKDENGTCIDCFYSCATCNGPTRDNCLSCKSGFYYVPGKNKCVTNCEAQGLFTVQGARECRGCHPACEKCFGPNSDQCTQCKSGFVLSNTTCDDDCEREDTYIKDRVCYLCNYKCSRCYGPTEKDCTACRAPYSLTEGHICVFNKTLDSIMKGTYGKSAFKDFLVDVSIVVLVCCALVGAAWYARRRFLQYQSLKDRDFTAFRSHDLTAEEKLKLQYWAIEIPEEHQGKASFSRSEDETELYIHFTQDFGNNILLKANKAVKPTSLFRYFEVEILENPNYENTNIVIGIVEKGQFNPDIKPGYGPNSIAYYGREGILVINGVEKQMSVKFTDFGESFGLCMILEEEEKKEEDVPGKKKPAVKIDTANKEEKKKKKKKPKKGEEIISRGKVIFNKNGEFLVIPEMENLFIPANVEYVPVFGSNGPCKLAINIGGKLFRAHHGEIEKGLLQRGSEIEVTIEPGATDPKGTKKPSQETNRPPNETPMPPADLNKNPNEAEESKHGTLKLEESDRKI